MILKFRATIPQSKIFYKVYAVKGDMNLFDFNAFILGDLGFAPDQMVMFEGYDEKGALCGEYGLFDMGDGAMDSVSFNSLVEKGQTEIRYFYDMRNNRYIKLVFEGEESSLTSGIFPMLLDEKGHAPEQFSTTYEDYEAVQNLVPHPYGPAKDEDLDDDEEDDDDEDEDEDGDGDDEDGAEIYDENE